MTARTALLIGIVAALVLAATFLLFAGSAKTAPAPVSCTAANSCVLPDQGIPTDNLDYSRE